MRIDRIAAGDIVKAAVKGRTIYGEVTEITGGTVHFRPLTPAAGWRHASAVEIVAHWRRAGRRGAGAGEEPDTAPPPREQLSLPLHH